MRGEPEVYLEDDMSGTKLWFGKHQNVEISEVPGGYLRWMVNKMDPTPRDEDRVGKTPEQIKAMGDRMRDLIFEAEDELHEREQAK